MMRKEIESFIDDLKSNKKLPSFDEASTKQAVVLRLLSFLGWDIFNVEEVYPNYSINSHSVSFALRIKNNNKVFIEVKRVHEKLDNHQKQLVIFAGREGVDLSVLTNGIIWWFYLASAKDDWQQKWFLSVDLFKQKPDVIVPPLIDLLSKNKISRGQALKEAKALYQNKKQKMAADFVPQAWNQIISQPNKIFVELLSEATEKICGYKVESDQIEKFIKKHLNMWLFKDVPSLSSTPPAKISEPPIILEDKPISQTSAQAIISGSSLKPIMKKHETYEGKTIESFTFNGRNYAVRHWEEVLTTLCGYFAASHTKDFERVLWISGENNTYFSRYQDQLHIPEKIKKTDIYVETKLSPDEIVKTAKNLLAEFGYSRDLLKISTQ
jgi:predicted type IV restriction endonuclease